MWNEEISSANSTKIVVVVVVVVEQKETLSQIVQTFDSAVCRMNGGMHAD